MDKYNNLNICNVLYNRPSQLDKTYASENINDDNRLLYKLKLLQLSPEFLRDGAYEYFRTVVENCIDGNVSELLCLSIALMGGAYKEQLNYLGLFPIKEVTGKSSVCRCYIQNINKRTFNIGTNIIDTIFPKCSLISSAVICVSPPVRYFYALIQTTKSYHILLYITISFNIFIPVHPLSHIF